MPPTSNVTECAGPLHRQRRNHRLLRANRGHTDCGEHRRRGRIHHLAGREIAGRGTRCRRRPRGSSTLLLMAVDGSDQRTLVPHYRVSHGIGPVCLPMATGSHSNDCATDGLPDPERPGPAPRPRLPWSGQLVHLQVQHPKCHRRVGRRSGQVAVEAHCSRALQGSGRVCCGQCPAGRLSSSGFPQLDPQRGGSGPLGLQPDLEGLPGGQQHAGQLLSCERSLGSIDGPDQLESGAGGR